MRYDRIIIGAGLYGLYSAWLCGKRGEHVAVLECDPAPFMRATYINQARVHMGYHYPRSLSTAEKSAGYFERFVADFQKCIHSEFKQIYATSARYSWTSASQFKKFCNAANIFCEEVAPSLYFKDKMCDGAFLTKEYTYDATILRNEMMQRIEKLSNVDILYNIDIKRITHDEHLFYIETDESVFESPFVLNASYASVNQINKLAGFESYKIKYELCEIILCEVDDCLNNIGLTVMDGPFFSIMPFGKTGYHSLTSVTFTPHMTCKENLPFFSCQSKSKPNYCSPEHLGNCNLCVSKPESSWSYMSNLAHKYMLDKYHFNYKESLFSMKPILRVSEIDDSRPTVIKQMCSTPKFVSVLSGKINTIYDLDEVLNL